MSKEEFKKLILHRGKIDRYIFLLSFFVQNTYIKDVFRVLQEIDNTVYKYSLSYGNQFFNIWRAYRPKIK